MKAHLDRVGTWVVRALGDGNKSRREGNSNDGRNDGSSDDSSRQQWAAMNVVAG